MYNFIILDDLGGEILEILLFLRFSAFALLFLCFSLFFVFFYIKKCQIICIFLGNIYNDYVSKYKARLFRGF